MLWKNLPGRSMVQGKVRGSRSQKMKSLIFYVDKYQVYPVDDMKPIDRFQWGMGLWGVFLSFVFSLLLTDASRFTEMRLPECLLVTIHDTLWKHLTSTEGLSSGRHQRIWLLKIHLWGHYPLVSIGSVALKLLVSFQLFYIAENFLILPPCLSNCLKEQHSKAWQGKSVMENEWEFQKNIGSLR